MKGIVLFGHGSRNPDWAKPFHAIQEAILSLSPCTLVKLAFLESMRPTLDEAVDELAKCGADEIDIVPVFLATGGHVAKDLPQLAANAMVRHPHIAIAVAAPAGESGLVIDAMAAYALKPQMEKAR
ncbi:MAG: CbiX/SirB N-terminal domain-containing protein [Georgfuchsia sp.]